MTERHAELHRFHTNSYNMLWICSGSMCHWEILVARTFARTDVAGVPLGSCLQNPNRTSTFRSICWCILHQVAASSRRSERKSRSWNRATVDIGRQIQSLNLLLKREARGVHTAYKKFLIDSSFQQHPNFRHSRGAFEAAAKHGFW